MGSATLELGLLELGRPMDITLPLHDPNRTSAQLGEIILTATLYPKTQEDKEQVGNYNYFISLSFLRTYILSILLNRSVR